MNPPLETDVVLVGAGPIGIELAVALKRERVDYVHLEASAVGSTIFWYAPGTHFYSSPERIAIAGVPLQTADQTKATREEYLLYLRSVVQQFDLPIRTYERVEKIARRPDGRFLVTSRSASGVHETLSRRIVLAIGDMHEPRMIGVPGEELPHVSHYFADPHVYFRRHVLIVGGRNSAVEAAIRCVRAGAQVTMSYRGSEFDPKHVKAWLLPDIRSMIREQRIDFYPQTTVCEIRPDSVVLRIGESETFDVAADAVLLLTGYAQDSSLLEMAGVALEGESRRPRLDPQTMESNVRGVYVAGTAVAGTQLGGVKEFIETSHVHVERIIAALKGSSVTATAQTWDEPES